MLSTGYEQVRSIGAAIAGDWNTAKRVELMPPETGVCNTQFADHEVPVIANPGCFGGPAIVNASACCVKDDKAKAEGAEGCGWGPKAVDAAPVVMVLSPLWRNGETSSSASAKKSSGALWESRYLPARRVR